MGASHQWSSAVGAGGAADQALAEAVGVEHVSARRDPRHVHRLQAHRARGPRLPQLLLTWSRDTRDAGFIILDGIRMLCEKMSTLILHFNFYTNIILVFKFIKGILFFLDLNGETRGKNNAL